MRSLHTKITRLYAAQLREAAYSGLAKKSYTKYRFALKVSAASIALFLFGVLCTAAILLITLNQNV